MITEYRRLFFHIIILLIFMNCIVNAQYSITYTPEGKPMTNIVRQQFSDAMISSMNAQTDQDIIDLGLDAVRIGAADYTYNCYGYTFLTSEDRGENWLEDDMNSSPYEYSWPYFYEDENYSNDNLASYIIATEAIATHADTDDGHAVRKIQNSYPTAIQVLNGITLDYVSKWGYLGVVQHSKFETPYFNSGTNFTYLKLKTSHSGTLSSYPKTWIGAGNITHVITGDLTVNSLLTIMPGTVVKFVSGSKLIINGRLVADGVTFQAESGSWDGIYINSTSASSIDDCTITGCEYGLTLEGSGIHTYCKRKFSSYIY